MLSSPYDGSTDWLRGNLHAHTTRSDGKRDPQLVIDDYAERGYDFLMISDHDMVTSPSEFQSRGMVLIPGNEVTASGPHLLHINAGKLVPPYNDRQNVLDEITSDDNALAVMAHPNWHRSFDHINQAGLRALKGYVGIEIYNGVIERLPGSPYATDQWDQLLSSDRRVWGFANDDSHAVDGDVELGWNVVQAERSVESIVDALRRGAFYASTGVRLIHIELHDGKILVQADEVVRFSAYREHQRRFATHVGRNVEIEVPTDAKLQYVRIEADGPQGARAWTQPFFVEHSA